MSSRERYWLVWVDDTPDLPECPLTAKEAAEQFLREVGDLDMNAPDSKIELRQCTREDLDWAGEPYSLGLGADEELEEVTGDE